MTVWLRVLRWGGLADVSRVSFFDGVALDTAALQTVSRAGGFPPAPEGLAELQYSFHLQISFKT